ncbi:MAG: GFA family protein [Acidiferrobacterales bacterium]|nr:GFA family protein [Acidiferrobacterales bacterium]
MTVTGSCLCGQVHYVIKGSLVDADHCHCSKCRRQHGAAFSSYAGFDPGDFQWTSGEKLVSIYEESSGAGWCFCKCCGSTLAGSDDGEITSIAMGTVDGDPGMQPEKHIYVGSKADWYEIHDDLPQFQKRVANG